MELVPFAEKKSLVEKLHDRKKYSSEVLSRNDSTPLTSRIPTPHKVRDSFQSIRAIYQSQLHKQYCERCFRVKQRLPTQTWCGVITSSFLGAREEQLYVEKARILRQPQHSCCWYSKETLENTRGKPIGNDTSSKTRRRNKVRQESVENRTHRRPHVCVNLVIGNTISENKNINHAITLRSTPHNAQQRNHIRKIL